MGAVLATWVYARWGWPAVCALGAGISMTALGYWLWTQADRAADAARSGKDQNL
ncbi:hypothetical protein D3C71_2122290 [compost metagenome]